MKYTSGFWKPFSFLIILSLYISSSSFSQIKTDTDHTFQDELLDHFVGKWNLTGTVNGSQVNVTLESEWVMNHQWLRIHEMGPGNMPGKDYPYEGEFYLGYNNLKKCYIRFLMNVYGGDDPASAVYTGNKKGNEIRLSSGTGQGLTYIEQFIWEPESQSWHIISRTKKAGKEQAPYLDMRATRQ